MFQRVSVRMPDNLPALIAFVLITSFTPGPANISSASMGLLYGYRNTLRYIAGLVSGFVLVMLLSAVAATAFLTLLPAAEPVLRIIGAGYILYLAVAILKASYTFDQTETQAMGWARAVLLQLLNPKLIVYGLTLFTTFLSALTDDPALLILAICLLASMAFCATSTWALFGAVIKRYLHQPRMKQAVNILLALALVYVAADMLGIV